MGPSGCGKTTLLDVLAHRRTNPKFKLDGDIFVNGVQPSLSVFQKWSSYVEQEGTVPQSRMANSCRKLTNPIDSLIGSLTARETLSFAAKLALPKYVRHLPSLVPLDPQI